MQPQGQASMTAPTDQQDREDMARLAAGGDGALDRLMERHAERLHNYLLRILQNETEAGDLAEEAFVRVYEHRARFDPRHRFSTWLFTIATNLTRDLQRSRARHPQVSLDKPAGETDHDFNELLPDSAPIPGQTLEAEERATAVRRAIAALPEDLRVPLVLSEYEEKSHAEIAEILDCSPKAVEMRVYRARQRLRADLQELLAETA
jgi:RNA polymerase sigma-70 factor (ECF subfamily)